LVICPQCGGFGVTVLVVARNDTSPDDAAAVVNIRILSSNLEL